MAATARKIDPATRDVVFDDAARTWATTTPELALVRSVLSTPRGRRLADASFGVEWPDRAARDVETRTREAILAGLRRWSARGVLRDVEASAEVKGEAVFYEVTFKGRDGARRSVRGQLP